MKQPWRTREEPRGLIMVMGPEKRLSRWEGSDGVVLAEVKRGKLVVNEIGQARGYAAKGLRLDEVTDG